VTLQAVGPDVSRWQGSVDWNKVLAAGAGIGIAKATEGIDFVDPTFTPARYKAMQKAGLLRSFYHYGRPQPGRSGGEEAHFFLRVVRAAGYGQHGDMPLTLDIEWTKLGPAATHRWIGEFVSVILAETGAHPFIYVSPGWWADNVQRGANAPRSNFGCPLWIAHYTSAAHPTIPSSWAGKGWTMWQHTDRGHIAGVNGPCDLNVCSHDYRWMRAHVMDQGRIRLPARPTPPRRPSHPPVKPPKAPKHPPAAGHYPPHLPARFRELWDKPWLDKAANNKAFRTWLDNHGYWTPHFKLDEAKCKDGSPVPKSLNKRCRDHAFNLEKLRHELGDRPIPILSWYRSPSYNRKIGGASQSKHMEAIATDHTREWVNAVGRLHVLNTADRLFRNGGMGVYPWGALHVDTRGVRARWSSW
jgi:GH25 family lysozyme M1 (1,4-beta-N-acetylmuramidase)